MTPTIAVVQSLTIFWYMHRETMVLAEPQVASGTVSELPEDPMGCKHYRRRLYTDYTDVYLPCARTVARLCCRKYACMLLKHLPGWCLFEHCEHEYEGAIDFRVNHASRCKVKAPCCGVFFTCHNCHDDAVMISNACGVEMKGSSAENMGRYKVTQGVHPTVNLPT